MKRLGVIAGEVLDENGLGLPNVAVYAYQVGARLRLAQSGLTNDRGSYRIAGLGPGAILCADGASRT
jgi:protocatechuate 3,4-dioxygenase beta subunit